MVTEGCGPILKRKGISWTAHVWFTHPSQKPEVPPGFFQNVRYAPPAILPRWLLPVSMSQSRMFEPPKAGVFWGTGSPWEGSKKQWSGMCGLETSSFVPSSNQGVSDPSSRQSWLSVGSPTGSAISTPCYEALGEAL